VASGPFIVGALRDLTSYRTAFLVMAALAVFGGLVFRVIGEPGDHHRRTHNRPSTPRSTRSLLAPVVFDVTEVTVDA
jgi:hypothetical protein